MEVTAVWLQTTTDGKIVVMVEVDGQWYEVIRELNGDRESTISHCTQLKYGLPSTAKKVEFG